MGLAEGWDAVADWLAEPEVVVAMEDALVEVAEEVAEVEARRARDRL